MSEFPDQCPAYTQETVAAFADIMHPRISDFQRPGFPERHTSRGVIAGIVGEHTIRMCAKGTSEAATVTPHIDRDFCKRARHTECPIYKRLLAMGLIEDRTK
jgi:hypothetical protein